MKAVSTKPMRDFELEVFFSKWEFKAKHHLTASDLESLSVKELLTLADEEDRNAFETLWLGYTETWGAPQLRQQIASTYDSMQPDNILCLAGAGEGLYSVAKVLLTEDDHVVVPTPNYQSAETIPLGICKVTGVPMDYTHTTGEDSSANSWSLDIDKLIDHMQANTKLVSLNFPHNPTGSLIKRESLDRLIDHCRQNGTYILCDEVYRGVELNPADTMPQIADVYERGISLNVMSKAYGLPGLRIGWLASQDTNLLQRIERYKHYLSICNSGPSEMLSIIALKSRVQILQRNRKIMQANVVLLESLLEDFPDLIEWQPPQGGCVAYPKYTGPGNSETFCRKLVEESGVLLLPSSTYTSELTDTPAEHFRIGIGRDRVFSEGLAAMGLHLEKHYR